MRYTQRPRSAGEKFRQSFKFSAREMFEPVFLFGNLARDRFRKPFLARHTSDPITNRKNPCVINQFAAEIRHVPAARGGHAIEHDAAARVASRNDARFRKSETSDDWFFIDQPRIPQRSIEIHERSHCPAAGFAMANAAI